MKDIETRGAHAVAVTRVLCSIRNGKYSFINRSIGSSFSYESI